MAIKKKYMQTCSTPSLRDEPPARLRYNLEYVPVFDVIQHGASALSSTFNNTGPYPVIVVIYTMRGPYLVFDDLLELPLQEVERPVEARAGGALAAALPPFALQHRPVRTHQ